MNSPAANCSSRERARPAHRTGCWLHRGRRALHMARWNVLSAYSCNVTDWPIPDLPCHTKLREEAVLGLLAAAVPPNQLPPSPPLAPSCFRFAWPPSQVPRCLTSHTNAVTAAVPVAVCDGGWGCQPGGGGSRPPITVAVTLRSTPRSARGWVAAIRFDLARCAAWRVWRGGAAAKVAARAATRGRKVAASVHAAKGAGGGRGDSVG